MVKLYNKTTCPDEILRPLLAAAGRRIGAKTDVVVKVTQKRSPRGGGGVAKPGIPYLWHLSRKRKGVQRDRLIHTNGGWIEIPLPCTHAAYDPIDQAERFFHLALHEWAHIKDFQDQNNGEQRPFCNYSRRWANRPHERRACRMATEARERYYSKTAEAAILALAEWLESQVAED